MDPQNQVPVNDIAPQPQSPAPQPVQDKPKHKYLPVLLTIFVMLLLATAVAGGVWYYMDQQSKTAANDNATQVAALQKQINALNKKTATAVTTTTTTATSPTNGWQTYKNSTYNFSFKYPVGVVVNPSGAMNSQADVWLLIDKTENVSANGVHAGDVSTAYFQQINATQNYTGSTATINSTSGNITAIYRTDHTPYGYTYYSYYFQKGNKYYEFRMDNYDNKPVLMTTDQFKTMVDSITFS